MKASIILLGMSFLGGSLHAQIGYGISSASYAYHNGIKGQIVSPKEIVEEEIFNYHDHRIEAANFNDPVKVSFAWGNKEINAHTEEMILQIGLATNRVTSLDQIPPANLSLVVDVSGSMSGFIDRSKDAMKVLINSLRSDDKVSLVLFGSSVFTPFPSQVIGDKTELLKAIDAIQIQGSTDVHAGMLEGYKQVASTYLPNGSNRVIVFTDAMANTGLIDPNAIIENTKVFIRHIDLTFIGIGSGFNQDFAREIKTRLRGHLHFVEDSREMTKLFTDEVEQFLVKPFGKEAKLIIDLPAHLELAKFYGYAPKISGGKIEIDLDMLQGGLTQVFMLKLLPKNGFQGDTDLVKCQLSYVDQNGQPALALAESPALNTVEGDSYDKLANQSVKKNYCIAYMAGQFKLASINYEKNPDATTYHATIGKTLEAVKKEFPTLDADLQFVHDILEKVYDPAQVNNTNLALADLL